MNIYRISQDDFLAKLISLRPEMAAAAQQEYDAWEQDENGMDEVLGSGGICQEIAEAICSMLFNYEISCSTIEAQIGEQHVWVIAWEHDEKSEEGHNAYHIDIPPHLYENGGGYVWGKLADVIFVPDMIFISKADDEIVDYFLSE